MADIVCTTAAEFGTALSAAVYGDVIKCTAGTTFTHASSGWQIPTKTGYTEGARITITTTATTGIPATGVRITSAHTANIPYFRPAQTSGQTNTQAFRCAPTARGWLLKQIGFKQSYGGGSGLVHIGSNTADFTLKSHQVQDIDLDQVHVSGLENPIWGQRGGIHLHGKNLTVKNSWIVGGGPSNGPDTQGIYSSNGEGPYTEENNKIEGWTYNRMFMGENLFMKSIATVSASPAPTTTSCRVVVSNGGDAPVVGQVIAIATQAGAMRLHPQALTVTTVNSTTYDLTYLEIADTPDVGGSVVWGVQPKDVTIRNCYFTKPVEWRDNAILATPANVTAAQDDDGSLTAGTYLVRVAATASHVNLTNGTFISSVASAPITVNVTSSTGAIDVDWDAVTNAETYRVYVTHPDGTVRYVTVSSGTATSYTTNGTTATVPAGTKYSVKNMFEGKGVINFLMEDCVFENDWPGNGSGYAIWWKCTNQGSAYGTPYLWTSNATFRRIRARNIPGFMRVVGCEHEATGALREVNRPKLMDGLLVQDIEISQSGGAWLQGGTGIWAFALFGGKNITLERITAIHTSTGFIQLGALVARAAYLTNLTVRDNLALHNTYGIKGADNPSTATGTSALDAHSQGSYSFTFNALGAKPSGTSSSLYPAGTLFPDQTAFEAYFENYAAGDYRLASGSAAAGVGTGGGDLGADVETLNTNLASVVLGDSAVTTPTITTTSLSNARVGVPYSVQLLATGGDLPYTFTRQSGGTFGSGVLSGMTLSSTGLWSGTPTTAGSSTVVVLCTDNTSDTDTQSLTLTVDAAVADPLVVLPGALPTGGLLVPYEAQLVASGGVPPYAYELAEDSNDLPEGMSLDLLTGVLSGTPTETGITVLIFQVRDSAGTAVRQVLLLTIGSAEYEYSVGDIDQVALEWYAATNSLTTDQVFSISTAQWIAAIRASFDAYEANLVSTAFKASPLATRVSAKSTLGVED